MFIQGTRGRVRVSTYGDAMEEDDDFEENDIGLAFSGGGIRSAAFCSGVLRRLLQKDIKVNYVSCISGGNFTAAAYLDWKFRHGNEDDPKWHQEFFDHMRKRIGYVCDWQNCFKGIGDTITLLLLMLIVNLLIPLTVWGGLAIPVAYLVDFMYGEIMRAGFDCSNITIPQQQFLKNVTKCGNVYNLNDTETIKQLILFVTLAVIFLFLYVVKVIIKRTTRVCNFLQLVAGVMLGLVFMPWFMQQFTDIIPAWMNVLILGLSIFFWCGFPPLRNYAALAIIFYLYGYIIKWRVYHSGFSFEYQEHYFYTALLAAGVVLWASPYLGVFTRTAIYNFIKWRLQFAFFTRQSVGRCGCNGITCSDLFPVLSTLCSCSACANKSDHQALTMADIVHTNPQYISNIVADYWRRDAKRVPETMIGLCSKKIEIITDEPGLDQLNCKLKPGHIKLADAMSTAAMITKPPAELKEKFEPFRELQLILGLSATHNINSKPDEDFGCKCEWFKIVPFILQSFSGAPLIFLAVVWLAELEFEPVLIERLVMIVFISYVLIFAAVAMLPTGGKKPWCAETIVRWCHVHLYHVRFLREILKINNTGPLPPAIMSLSDLGRVEKYGLLPLFKRRMKKIVIVDGSFLKTNADYASYLLSSLQMAREMFYCEFIGYDCRDVISQLHKSYLTHPSGKLPRSFKFIVKYFDKTPDGFAEAGQGEILLLSPRHPDEGFEFPSGKDPTWGEYTRDTNIKLDPHDWGPGPVLTKADADRLTFCCCECCHCNVGLCRCISSKMCFEFPRHSTLNQLFTPSMFSAYHREGYRSCIEADVDTFLSDSGIKNV